MIEHDIFQTIVYFRALEELEAKSPYANPIANPTVNSTINVNSPLNSHITHDSPLIPQTNPTIIPTTSTFDSTINSTIKDLDYTLIHTDKEIIKRILANPRIKQSELAKDLSITRDSIAKRIRILTEKRIISRTGARKNGSWIVNIKIDSIFS